MVSLSAKAVCIIDCHNKLVYMNDFYQNLFNEEKIGYKTKLGDAVINAVSYTHLDVYKRQLLNHSAPC